MSRNQTHTSDRPEADYLHVQGCHEFEMSFDGYPDRLPASAGVTRRVTLNRRGRVPITCMCRGDTLYASCSSLGSGDYLHVQG